MREQIAVLRQRGGRIGRAVARQQVVALRQAARRIASRRQLAGIDAARLQLGERLRQLPRKRQQVVVDIYWRIGRAGFLRGALQSQQLPTRQGHARQELAQGRDIDLGRCQDGNGNCRAGSGHGRRAGDGCRIAHTWGCRYDIRQRGARDRIHDVPSLRKAS